MSKIKLFILIFIICIPFCFANVVINPNPIDVVVNEGVSEEFNFSITNNFDFEILDFSFSNTSGFTFPSITLQPNTTQDYSFSVLREDFGEKIINSKVSFYYLVDLPDEAQIYFVNITDTGFEPDFLAIKEGDTVKWLNNDDITRSVTSSYFDQNVAPNQTFSYTFSNIGEVPYQDLILYFGATIQVINATDTEKVNNPDYNIIWNIDLDVTLDPTLLNISFDKRSFNVSATGSEESLLRIVNTGNETAQSIKLSADPSWIIFDENNFDILSGENNYVTFRVEPSIFEVEETNKTYDIWIEIEGSNTEIYRVNLSLFVPYSSIFEDVNTNEGFLAVYERFCAKNPHLLMCNNTVTESQETQIIIRDPEIPVNLSTREVLAMLDRIQRIEDSNDRTNNEIKKITSDLEKELPFLKDLLNKSVAMQEENEQRSTARTRALWIAILFAIIIISIVVLGWKYNKYSSRKSNIDGGFSPR